MRRIRDLTFENSFVESLPMESSGSPRPRQVPGQAGSLILPTPVQKPQLVAWSNELAKLFDLAEPESEDLEILVGNSILPSMKPFAARYGGHQFGHWAGQLGDGRAITLGEVKDLHGRSWEFQLKGAGPTPYSRGADGRAVLRSSIREFICSEAMHFLGVPTTRALSLLTTGEEVVRDMFYDGNPKGEPGAIVCRVSPSFLRFGNFQIFAAFNEKEPLRKLLKYTLERFFPHLQGDAETTVISFFHDVAERTALLMAEWMRVGFVHGVMNTDNLSILGLTIDYGPYGWLDNYDPHWTPNTTDLPGRRYAFGRQPSISFWNLAQMANALVTAFPQHEEAFAAILEDYQGLFQEKYLESLAGKLGLQSLDLEQDEKLIVDLDRLMTESQIDMTLFYRHLAHWSEGTDEVVPAYLHKIAYAPISEAQAQEWRNWFALYGKALRERAVPEKLKAMNKVNPLYVPRNYLTQMAIDAAEAGDFSKVRELYEVLQNPYTEQAGKETYQAMRPEWAKDRPGCSTLSCSS